MKIKFSEHYWAIRKRIQRLPEKELDKLTTIIKLMALTTVKYFHDGIKDQSLGLKELKDKTVQRKRRESFTMPEVPLYGAGDERKDDSYVNMMRLRKIDGFGKKGWQVYVSRKKHWKSKLKLSDLFVVHEYGTIIKAKNGAMIRIPARPAFHKAYERVLKEKKKSETSKVVKKAIAEMINKNTDSLELKIAQRQLEGLAKFEKHD